jgi:MoxR-like ATPase
MVRALAASLSLDSKRVKFTPDLMPGDVTGSLVYDNRTSAFSFRPGPVFTNLLLADEINRTPPKTQASLLEVMEEGQVTVDGTARPLPDPFLVAATQNPIEYEGTFPLPEAQLDRFIVKLSMGYPQSVDSESTILKRRIGWRKDDPSVDVKPVIDKATFLALQDMVETAIYIDPGIIDYISQIVRATREHPRVTVGASPRGGLALLKLSRAMAVINGRDFVVPDDVKMFAPDVLVHRIILRVEDAIEGAKEAEIVQEIIDAIPAPVEFARKGAA